MSEHEKLTLAIKAIRSYAQAQWGWGAKYHPEEREKFDALMQVADSLQRGKPLNCGEGKVENG